MRPIYKEPCKGLQGEASQPAANMLETLGQTYSLNDTCCPQNEAIRVSSCMTNNSNTHSDNTRTGVQCTRLWATTSALCTLYMLYLPSGGELWSV